MRNLFVTTVAALLISSAGVAEAFTFTSYGPGTYTDAVAGLDGPGVVFEDFEDTTLIDGLSVEWVGTPPAALGPVTVLPNLFEPASVYGNNSQAWDGSHTLTNSVPNDFSGNLADITELHFAGGRQFVGVGISNIEYGGAAVIVNGNALTVDVNAQPGLWTGAARGMYILIQAEAGESIDKIGLTQGAGDSLMFDHVATNAIPEPSTYLLMILLVLGFVHVRVRP